MCLSKNTCRISLSKKLNEKDSIYENRLSIIENVEGKDEEVLFVKDSSEEGFMKKLTKKISQHELKHFTFLRPDERYSKKLGTILKEQPNMKRVSNELYQKVKKFLAKERSKVIAQKKQKQAMLA